MFWQIASVLLSTAASVTASLSSKTAFSTPPIYVTIEGTKWAVSTSWTPQS